MRVYCPGPPGTVRLAARRRRVPGRAGPSLRTVGPGPPPPAPGAGCPAQCAEAPPVSGPPGPTRRPGKFPIIGFRTCGGHGFNLATQFGSTVSDGFKARPTVRAVPSARRSSLVDLLTNLRVK
eukprot:759557-Hanusia_phi.AAC.2